ncbi:hypothetical protein SprV_0401580300 [Sparganum proliferum]
MLQARDRQRESLALSDSSHGKSVANTFRHRSSSKRGHELPPLLNDNKVFLIDDTDKAELFSAFFAKHLNTESEPVPFADKKAEKINRFFACCTRDVSTDTSVNVSEVPLETEKYIAHIILQTQSHSGQ